MSDETNSGADGTPTGPVAGERLAEARRLKQISLPDVARQLHLDEARVQALEENRFDVLGAPVFAKGYLRKYANLVGASIDDIMADYYTLNRATGAPPVVGPPRPRHRELHAGRWMAGTLAIVVIGGALYAWMQRTPAEAPETTPPAGTRVPLNRRDSDDDAGAVADIAAETDDQSNDADLAPAPPPRPEPAAGTDTVVPPPREQPAASAAAAPPAAAGQDVELRLTYEGDCWTEVSDANGRRLFFDLGSAGRTVTVSGAPPLRVLLGNDDNVRLTVNGRPYTIAAADRRGDTARFTISR